MNNPRVTAIVSGIAALLLGWRIFGGGEGVSPLLGALQWLLFAAALVGLVGSLVQMSRK
jgi:hypothetical protein